MRLQTNLFYLDKYTIGIFKTACQLEHSCRPNAIVQSVGSVQDATLAVRSLCPISRGERVSFCYLSDHGHTMPLADELKLAVRRPLLHQQLGFVCQCAACVAEEATTGA